MGSSENMMIVQVPYGPEESVIFSGTQASRIPRSSYAYFDSSVDSNFHPGLDTVFIYPDLRKRKNNSDYLDELRRNRNTLTDNPVVYIVVIDLETAARGWLSNVLHSQSSFTGIRYVVYVGETNDIRQRTNQHLNASNYEATFETDDDSIPREMRFKISEQTSADYVIRKAINDHLKVKQYVIWDYYFTKSMTLDLEHKFIDYVRALENVHVLNGRGNPQKAYFMHEEKDAVCSRIWNQLSIFDPDLFPPEHDIWNMELYKVSPFHALGEGQKLAVNSLCNYVNDFVTGNPDIPIHNEMPVEFTAATIPNKLIIVEGASGTGKSIVLSTLFVRLSQMLRDRSAEQNDYGIRPNNKVCLVVNQDAQLNLYTNLAIKLGLMDSTSEDKNCVVYKAMPFINSVARKAGKRNNPEDWPDVVLIDEAHLLAMRPDRTYTKKLLGNQLFDILLRSKVVIAVLDPEQVMRTNQNWDSGLLSAINLERTSNLQEGEINYVGPVTLSNYSSASNRSEVVNTYRLELTQQFRVGASTEQLLWIDRLCDTEFVGMNPIPTDSAYDIRIFTSPKLLDKVLKKRREEEKQSYTGQSHSRPTPLCRLLATYDWPYKTSSLTGTVTLVKRGGNWSIPEGIKFDSVYDESEYCFSRAWNYMDIEAAKKVAKSQHIRYANKDMVWSTNPDADNEVGSYFTIQGFDLNYAGVIIGPSITYRDGRIVVNREYSCDSKVEKIGAEKLIINQLKILLRRAIKGLYIFAVDPDLQAALEIAARTSGVLDKLD